jgi:o-succinylbenzoate synthase
MDHQSLRDISVELYRYAIPLTAPLSIRGTRLSQREGLVLLLKDADGRIGVGEASPLPGFSAETLEDSRDWLNAWCAGLPPKARLTAPRSALHAVSQAMVELKSRATGSPPHRILSGKAGSHVHVNAVILRDEDIDVQLDRVHRLGYRAVKLKVGGDPIDAAEAVAHLTDRLDPGIALRLDANRSWTMEQALAFAARVSPERIDYLEEPLIKPADLERFAEESSVPVALDESVADWSRERLAAASFARAWVLKPMILGGAGEIWAIMRLAERAGVRCVFSGSFESDLGRRHLLAMAAAWAKRESHGVDTARFLAESILLDRSADSQARIDVGAELHRHPALDFSKLDRVW